MRRLSPITGMEVDRAFDPHARRIRTATAYKQPAMLLANREWIGGHFSSGRERGSGAASITQLLIDFLESISIRLSNAPIERTFHTIPKSQSFCCTGGFAEDRRGCYERLSEMMDVSNAR